MNTKKIVTECVNDIHDIKKQLNSLKVELMTIKSRLMLYKTQEELLKDIDFEKITTSEATSETFSSQDEARDFAAKQFWWS